VAVERVQLATLAEVPDLGVRGEWRGGEGMGGVTVYGEDGRRYVV
jgi:hypothetical protein